MNKNEEYFVSLIYSHLNNTVPAAPDNINWEDIYRLSQINNIVGIIASELQKLDKDIRPDSKTLSLFNQQLAYTLIDYEEKEYAIKQIKDLLTENHIDHIFIKGEIIKKYYPVKELRTSADTDIIIRNEDIDKIRDIVNNKNIEITEDNGDGITFKLCNQSIEIHRDADCGNEYFKDIFALCTADGNEYIIDDYNHLFYILCHIIKHFKYCGAGIKMFMDIDVVIRHIGAFDYQKALKMSRNIGIETFFTTTMALCRKLFNTPINADINADSSLLELFSSEIISAGSFGFEKRDISSFYAIKSRKNGRQSKLNAFKALLFPTNDYLKMGFDYAKKHPILLPAAWVHRLFQAVFKNGSHSLDTINSIANSNNDNYIQLLNELDL